MELITVYNWYYLKLLELIYAQRKMGRDIPERLIEEARHYGHLAEVPEEQLNVLEYVGHEGDPIH